MKINTLNRRRQLKPRRTPYFASLAKGKAIGFYRMADGGTWHARLRGPDGRQHYRALGGDIQSDYDEMVKAAMAWFDDQATTTGVKGPYTVARCVADYVAHLEVETGTAAATDARQRLEKHLVPKLGKIELIELTTPDIKTWRDGMVRVSDDAEDVRRSKDSANRVLAQAKAALNVAYRNDIVKSDTAWRRVQAFKEVGEARKLFLTDAQVSALLKHAAGGFRDLLRAAILTGARYGELAGARARDFDKRHGTLRVTGKTGTREVYLSDAALAFFKTVASNKLPDAWLLVKDDGEPWGKSHQHRPMKAAVQAAKLPRETVFYSLRHYYVSKALLAGIPAQVAAENVGTSIRMIEKHYGKFMPKDRRQMLNQVVLL